MQRESLLRVAAGSEMDTLLSIDDDALQHYPSEGLVIDLRDDHPFALAERARWARALAAGDVVFSLEEGVPVGVAVLGTMDGEPYLDQLSVRRSAMRHGHGSRLVAHALAWARARSRAGLWLNTYGHLSWNRPYYERRGFRVIPEAEWKPEMRGTIEAQRACLPRPEERVVMWQP